MVPERWEEHLLDDSAKRRSGHTPNKKIPDYWNGGIKWVSLADSSALDDGYIRNTDKEISAEGLQNSSAVMLPAETVILSRDAGVGKSAVLGEDMAVSQHFIAWTCDEQSKLNNWFLYNWLQMKKPLFERMAVGSTIKTIGLPFFKKLRINVPPLPEQRKIADILSTWDQAIEKTEALLSNARTQKRALMQQLLTGKRRFPVFEGQPWKEVRFEQVFDRVTRKNTVGNDNVLTISAQHGLVSQEQYFNKRVAAKDLSGYTLLHQGDFAYNKSYSNGYPLGAIKMREVDDPGVVSSLYLCFSLIDETTHSREFFRHFFEAGCFNHEIYKIAQEGARNHGLLNVSVTDFFRSWLRIPELDEQRLIARTIGTAETEEEVHHRQLMRLRTEKKALMQQLLTGKRRVKVEDDYGI